MFPKLIDFPINHKSMHGLPAYDQCVSCAPKQHTMVVEHTWTGLYPIQQDKATGHMLGYHGNANFQ